MTITIKPSKLMPQPIDVANHETESPADNGPFRYGWRYVEQTSPSGQLIRERAPLTLYDILHPQVGDFRVHSRDHEQFCEYLSTVFKAQLKDDPTAVVLHDVRVAWATNIEAHGPDIAVIFNVKTDQNWSTFDETKEYTKPTLVIEITSPSTRQTDLESKYKEYALVGVPYYIIVDMPKHHQPGQRSLLGYELQAGQYVPLSPNPQGWLWLPPVELWLGLEEGQVRCYDKQHQPISDYTSLTIELDHAQQREAEAKEREAQAKALAQQEAQARAEAQKAAQQEAKAKAEAQRLAQQEAQARAEAEQRIQQLEAELRRLRGE